MNVLNLSLDMGIAPCVVLSASSHIILSSRARHSTRVTRSSPVRFHLTRNTTDRRRIRRGYTVFRFHRNGFKDPSVYRREPLSLRSEPPLRRTRPTSLWSRRILFIYIYLYFTAVSPYRTYRRRCIYFFFFPYVRKTVPLLRSRRNLKEAGRFKTALFPTAAFSKDLNNIAFFSPTPLSSLVHRVFFAFAFS